MTTNDPGVGDPALRDRRQARRRSPSSFPRPPRTCCPSARSTSLDVPHGTTIVAALYDGGVVMAGDRRATAGNLIAQRDIEKVFAADDYSLVGIAGTAGLAIEIVRLYQVELEHYEKIEGTQLTLDGKANRLATMIRGNLAQAMQGLAVVPLFAGFDTDAPTRPRPDGSTASTSPAAAIPSSTSTRSVRARCSRAAR